ncbi:MAG: hypothetical protein OEX12_00010 [Gammaproteobacteria bacterium]|nr:hypothetical protein [Gammaproteobacteria bacterium]
MKLKLTILEALNICTTAYNHSTVHDLSVPDYDSCPVLTKDIFDTKAAQETMEEGERFKLEVTAGRTVGIAVHLEKKTDDGMAIFEIYPLNPIHRLSSWDVKFPTGMDLVRHCVPDIDNRVIDWQEEDNGPFMDIDTVLAKLKALSTEMEGTSDMSDIEVMEEEQNNAA